MATAQLTPGGIFWIAAIGGSSIYMLHEYWEANKRQNLPAEAEHVNTYNNQLVFTDIASELSDFHRLSGLRIKHVDPVNRWVDFVHNPDLSTCWIIKLDTGALLRVHTSWKKILDKVHDTPLGKTIEKHGTNYDVALHNMKQQ